MSSTRLDSQNTTGHALIGIMIASCLYGVTALQIWHYFRSYNDRFLIRAMVMALAVLGIGFELASMHAIYHRVVVNPGNPGTFAWTDLASIPLTAGIRTIVHLFYAVRIHLLSHQRDWVTPSVLCVLKVVEIGLAITATIRVAQTRSFEGVLGSYPVLTVTLASLSFLIASDVISTLVLSYYLHICRSGVKKTDTLINRLILYTINNGALTTAASIAVMIFLTSHSLIYYVIYMTVAHLYIGSLLSTLNSRDQIVNSRKHITIDTVELGSLQFANGWIASTNAGTNATKAGEIKTPVQVLVETQVESEDPNRDRKSSVEIRQAAGGSQPDIQINQ